ncbi:hypothetical protein EVAR_63317_1 [Eumeta japonica]|uniref:Uncharacterized protein n=1 Tax=Eumeta variegata TaxID=151549 RepID=A0A4C1YPB9_EUMVA|nr:hypothetical protein EVAR_63317_1 [Eumeta japonica]
MVNSRSPLETWTRDKMALKAKIHLVLLPADGRRKKIRHRYWRKRRRGRHGSPDFFFRTNADDPVRVFQEVFETKRGNLRSRYCFGVRRAPRRTRTYVTVYQTRHRTSEILRRIQYESH